MGSTPSEQERYVLRLKKKGIWGLSVHLFATGLFFALILALNPGPWEVHEDSPVSGKSGLCPPTSRRLAASLTGFSPWCEHHGCACLSFSVLSWFPNQSLRQRLLCYFFIRQYNPREQKERKMEMSQERRESQYKSTLLSPPPLGVKSNWELSLAGSS